MTNNTKVDKLPSGWVTAKIGDILHIVRGISFPKDAKAFEPQNNYVACLRTANVQYEVEWDDLWFVPKDYVKRDEQYVKPLDILISTANSLELVGKVAQVISMPYQSTLGAFISLIRVPDGLDPKFVYFQLSSFEVQSEIRKRASTTTNISNISTAKLKDVEIKIPPLEEQKNIVAKVEELFTQLDAGKANIERTKANLARYKASVLKAACEGRLVPTEAELARAEGRDYESGEVLLQRILAERKKKWEEQLRAKGKDPSGMKYKEPDRPDTKGLPELPEGWVWARVDQIGIVQLGRQRSPKHHTGPLMRPYLRAANITWDGLDLSDVMEMNFPPRDFENYHLEIDDVLVSEASGSRSEVGKPAIWRGQVPDCCFQNTVIRVQSLGPLATYLYTHFLRDAITGRFGEIAKGVGIHHLGATRLSGLVIALPPFAEQHRIVSESERRMSVIKELESALEASLKRAERLRQAILKRAFEGKLAPNDE